MQKVMTTMKRNQVVAATTGRVDLRYNPLSVEEDYFIPVRGNTGTKIESIAGGKYTGDIDDVKYLRDKLFSALKIPAAYISSDGEKAVEDKNLSIHGLIHNIGTGELKFLNPVSEDFENL